MSFREAKAALRAHANAKHAEHHQRFFKTGPGEYGEGDIFLGLRVPQVRAVAKRFKALSLKDLDKFLASPIHEDRLFAVFVLVAQYQKAGDEDQATIVDFYLEHTGRINNWDIVDASAHKILGHYLLERPRKILDQLVRSPSLWERRIAIFSTYTMIQAGDLSTTLKLAKKLLKDDQDLIHKATGWMLRELGKQDEDTLLDFLEIHLAKMPRTMLRYAIEKLPEDVRQAYLKGTR
ncbi:MAG: DNA alkylation repair protein [Planctomycetota bacterium]|nr:DNA alkylation repair protein [Planctomycetota bacterium]